MNISEIEIAAEKDSEKPIRVVMVANNASKKMGGEAGNSFYYFKLLQQRGIDLWMICHSRVKEELRQELSPEEFQKVLFVEDSSLHIAIWRLGKLFPYRINDLIFGQLLYGVTQITSRTLVKKLIKEQGIQLVYEPTPITPKGLSFMYDLGVPVVIGPLSGGMEFPPAFQYMDSLVTRISIGLGRFLSSFLHQIFPGKLRASALIVANEQTKEALPPGYKGKLYEVIDCAVDLSLETAPTPRYPARRAGSLCLFGQVCRLERRAVFNGSI